MTRLQEIEYNQTPHTVEQEQNTTSKPSIPELEKASSKETESEEEE